MQTRDPAILDEIAAYNREDCIATRVLRDWLLERRAGGAAQFGPFPLPVPVGVEAGQAGEGRAGGVARGAARDRRGDCALAGQLLDYHDRERKPVWWALFDRLEMTAEELLEDAESIGGLEPTGEPRPEERSKVYAFTYPAQEQKIGQGQDSIDPATGERAGEIAQLDRDARMLVLKRGPRLDEVPLPEALIPGGPYSTRGQEAALERFGRSLLARDSRYPAIESVLRREPFDRDVQTNEMAR